MLVSRRWQAVVLSMKPREVGWSEPGAPMRTPRNPKLHTVAIILASRLHRHLAHLGRIGERIVPTTPATLHSLADRMPHLLSLNTMMAHLNEPLVFPHQLRGLRLLITSAHSKQSLDSVVTTIAQQLPSLAELRSDYPHDNVSREVSFAPLVSIQSLRKLDLFRSSQSDGGSMEAAAPHVTAQGAADAEESRTARSAGT